MSFTRSSLWPPGHGRRFHEDEQRGRDQERDNQAAVTGSTLRYGWNDVTRRPCETARQEADALRHRGWAGNLKPCSPGCLAASPDEAIIPPVSTDCPRPGAARPRPRPASSREVGAATQGHRTQNQQDKK